MDRIIFATTFKNEQTASGGPARLTPIVEGATVSQNISSDGYTVQLTLPVGSSWELPLQSKPTLRWTKRNLRLTINSGGDGVLINTLGLRINSNRISSATLHLGNSYDICTVFDREEGVGRAFINSRYMGQSTDSDSILVENEGSEQAQISLTITNIAVSESTVSDAPISVDFTDLELTEVSNDGWRFSGDSLVQSGDKDNVIDTVPNVSTFTTGQEFSVSGDGEFAVQLVEAAGRIEADEDKFAVVTYTDSGPYTLLDPLQVQQGAFKGAILGSGDIKFKRMLRPAIYKLDTRLGTEAYVSVTGAEGVTVDWGDGARDDGIEGNLSLSHTYTLQADFELKVFGSLDSLEVGSDALVEVSEWGYTQGTHYAMYESGSAKASANLEKVPPVLPPTATSLKNMLRGAARFNDGSIVGWRTGNIENMDNMFSGASAFNQDLSMWCVENIPEEPEGFAVGASSWVLPKPVWGTCPARGIGVQGEMGFGVGVCENENWLTELGLEPMDGYDNVGSPNYGNYIHTTTGSISVFVPKFYYRIGSSESERFEKYGLNSFDIVDSSEFSSTEEANAAGYALHRAFIDDGKEKEGFFIDKYVLSKEGDIGVSKKNGQPISLTTLSGYVTSQGMPNCTGILADAITLSRARGYGWNCQTVFANNALAMISLAHGQAASSEEVCAWFDPLGVTNFPKGCNNNALGDNNDPTIQYVSSGESGDVNKPLTGSANHFAKTTHNGQLNGICDINGVINQMGLGITNYGNSATSTIRMTNGSAYIFKPEVKLADITEGWNGLTDAWQRQDNMSRLYDPITLPWGSTSGWVYFGNGNSQVFDPATSGDAQLLTSAGIPLNSGTSDSGTELFGNDGNYQYNIHNMFARCSGYWDASQSGVWYRTWSSHRAYSLSGIYGVRALAYGS